MIGLAANVGCVMSAGSGDMTETPDMLLTCRGCRPDMSRTHLDFTSKQ